MAIMTSNPLNTDPIKDSSSLIHIVNQQGELCTTSDAISAFMKSQGLLQQKSAYRVVGIMGAQSSGKSTLLNLLFGTHFEELNSQTGRQMTTKGIWLGSSALVRNILVMDLEGTDSVTRSQERHPFERQSALLALSVAEVLIINMWQHDIGRYVASNYGVLATVFEVNLSLLAESGTNVIHKTTLLFTIRDHLESDSPLQVISDQLRRDIDLIWADMKKPAQAAHLSINDLFELQFLALPHKRYEAQQFVTQVDLLRDRFANPANPQCLLKASLNESKSQAVPAAALGQFIVQLWSAISEHADLNLPSQKELLAMFTADHVTSLVLDESKSAIRNLTLSLSSAYSKTFSSDCTSLISDATSEFCRRMEGFHAGITDSKRLELEVRLQELIQPLLSLQMDHAKSEAIVRFRLAMDQSLAQSKSKAIDQFNEVTAKASKIAGQYFDKCFSENLVSTHVFSDVADRDRNTYVGQLNSDLSSISETYRQGQLTSLFDECKAKIGTQLIPLVSRYMDDANEDMWTVVNKTFDEWMTDLFDNLVERKLMGGLRRKDDLSEESSNLTLSIKEEANRQVFAEAKKHASFIKMKMQKRFDQLFRLDDNGLPRIWIEQPDIRSIFIKARDQSLALLNLFEQCRLTSLESADDALKPLLATPLLVERKAQFTHESEDALNSAEMSKHRSLSLSHTPVWVVPLLAILGWNEFMTILSNPLLLVLLIVLGVGFGVLYYLNLTSTALAFAKMLLSQLTTSLIQMAQPPPASSTPEPSRAQRPVSRSPIRMAATMSLLN